MNRTNLVIVTSLVLIITATLVAILVARGYSPNLESRTLQPTGILVATSDPDGARVYVNGKLNTATNNTINLPPGVYEISIEKEGYSHWSKKVEIKKEEVFKTNAFLFPKFAELSPLTLTGVTSPSVSPDQRRIVYRLASPSGEKSGIWILDMDSGRPLIGGVGLKQILRSETVPSHQYLWSPDSLQILTFTGRIATASANPYSGYLEKTLLSQASLLESTRLNATGQLLSGPDLQTTLSSWSALWEDKSELQLSKLKPALTSFIKENAASFSLSPDDSKILYTASRSAELGKMRTQYLPGSNPTPEIRTIESDNTYVYDIIEDRNYYLESCRLPTRN